MIENVIRDSDSYKHSHTEQYPEDAVGMYDYGEARSGKEYDKTVFFGLQYIMKKYLTTRITMEMVDDAQMWATAHGIPFNYDGWAYIATELKGKLPIKIRAIPEGMVIPVKNVLFTVQSTDPFVYWVASWAETILLKVWYTSNIATRSWYVKQLLQEFAEISSDAPFVDYQYNNFGDRGSSSVESAGIGGVAHLTQFMGTDNFNSLSYAKEYYNVEDINTIGHSIRASEHSSTTSWGRDQELAMIMNHLEKAKGEALVAAVMDSYHYFNTVREVCRQDGPFQRKINSPDYPTFVMRPDSGDPKDIINETLDIMEEECVPYTVNKKGFKVFTNMRIIWGDGINMDSIRIMLKLMIARGYSIENIAFGSGGWLMQQHDRDTQGWAVKCASIDILIKDEVGIEEIIERDVFKDPITAPGKKSKKGKITTYFNPNTKVYFVDKVGIEFENGSYDVLVDVFEAGDMVKEYTLAEVRANS